MNRRIGLRIAVVFLVAAVAVLVVLYSSGAFSGDYSAPVDQPSASDATSEEPASEDPHVSPTDAEFIAEPDRESACYIVVFLKSQRVVVYVKDDAGFYSQAERCFICSTGLASSPTRTGIYSIRRKYRWRLLVGDVYGQYSTGFSDSYLFHSVPYDARSASTLDTEGYYALGTPASHGCVRLCVRDAKWIYENCDYGTQVNIVDEECVLEGMEIPEINEETVFSGWDPSDPDPNSPYNT